ncbi:hypothetical protein [Paenibacillus sp. TC-CSREp1]
MQDIFLANIGIKGIVHECATRQAGRVGFIMKKEYSQAFTIVFIQI